MPSIQDWAAKCADRIMDEFPRKPLSRYKEEHIAAIIATYAEPLMQLVRESKRMHRHDEDRYGARWEHEMLPPDCCPQCCCRSWIGDERIATDNDEYPANIPDQPCDCGATEWNARVDAVLSGVKL